MSDIPHLWQILNQYSLEDTLTHSLSASATLVPGSKGMAKEDRAIYESVFGHAAQVYQRLSNTFNGFPVWQGITSPTSFIVKANIPVRVEEGLEFQQGRVKGKYIFTTPDPDGLAIHVGWKITEAPDVGSISDGISDTDVFRGYAGGLRRHPSRMFGFIQGGATPVPGTYFRSLVISENKDSAMLCPQCTLFTNKLCANLGQEDSLSVFIDSAVSLADFSVQADEACTARGMTAASFVTNSVLSLGPEDEQGPLFYAEGYACCTKP